MSILNWATVWKGMYMTGDWIWVSIAVLFLITMAILFINDVIKTKKVKEEADDFIQNRKDMIEGIQNRILECESLDDFRLIHEWAVSTVRNLQYELTHITCNHCDYGWERGQGIANTIFHLLDVKKSELTEKEIMNKR